jgi:hypothetical protein
VQPVGLVSSWVQGAARDVANSQANEPNNRPVMLSLLLSKIAAKQLCDVRRLPSALIF